MYIIPKQKRDRIECEVKPVYLEKIDELVKKGIEAARNEIGVGKKYAVNVGWFQKLAKDMLDENKDIYYKKIVKARPDELMNIYTHFKFRYPCKVVHNGTKYEVFEDRAGGENIGINATPGVPPLKKIRQFFQQCFPYDKFSDKDREPYNAYTFCKDLGINVCVYCNAQMTHTVITKRREKVVRPEIDHYFPKSRYPMFALSFYNMIPACHTCNGIKGSQAMHMKSEYHPYCDLKSSVSFAWRGKKLNVNFSSAKSASMNEIFKTDAIYTIYEDVAEKIVEKAQDYDKAYIDSLIAMMNKHSSKAKRMDKKTAIRKIFDFVPREECFDIPLGEMRHDIQRQIIQTKYGITFR